MKPQERIMVILLALLNFTHILDFMIMMPLGNLLMPRWNIDSSQYTLVVSAYSFASFASAFCAIFFADNFDRKKLLIFAYIGFLVGTFLCVLADNYQLMIAARIIAGFFGGLISAQVLSIIGDAIPYERRGQAMGMLMGGFGLASVVGVPLGLFVANKYTWYAPFILVVALGVVLIPFLLKYIPNITAHLANKTNIKEKYQQVIDTFHSDIQRTALAFSAILIVGHFIIIPLLNPFMVNNVKIAIENSPLIYLVGGISSLVTASFAGKLTDKFGKGKMYTYAALASLVFVIALTHMPVWPLWVVLSVFVFWFSAATCRTVPGQAMVTQAVPQERRGSFMSLNSCIQSIAQAIGMVLSSAITFSDSNHVIHNYHYLGYISVSLIVISIFFARRLNQQILEN